MKTRGGSFLVFVVISYLLVGCSESIEKRKMTPVSGKVLYQGKPVEGALVRFIADKLSISASATTNAEGQYRLTTYDTDDGAVDGDHLVVISKLDITATNEALSDPAKAQEEYLKMMSSSGIKGAPPRASQKALLPAKYSDLKTSGLRRTVIAGEAASFTFDLKD